VPDPVSNPRRSLKPRFWRIFRLLALFSTLVAAGAVVLVARGDPTLHLNMLIATALGIGFTVLLGSGLMALMFLSASSGHDDKATPRIHQEGDQ
jgi:energy-converting hydrogenase Eha subunit H